MDRFEKLVVDCEQFSIDHAFVTYSLAAMALAWIIRRYLSRKSRLSRLDRIVESFMCTCMTAVFCIVAYDLATDIHYSVFLLIGVFIGMAGWDGVSVLLRSALAKFNIHVGDKDDSRGNK